MLFREILNINTKSGISFLDITDKVEKIVEQYGIRIGMCNIYLTSTTAGIMINENERMLIEDFKLFFRNIVDEDKPRVHPQNATSHLRSQLVGISKNIPISNSKLILGNWQKIILWEFDKNERKREIIITINGIE